MLRGGIATLSGHAEAPNSFAPPRPENGLLPQEKTSPENTKVTSKAGIRLSIVRVSRYKKSGPEFKKSVQESLPDGHCAQARTQ